MQKCDFNKDAKQCAHIIVMFIQKTKKDIAEVHIHVTIHSFFLFNVYGYLLHSYITATIDQKIVSERLTKSSNFVQDTSGIFHPVHKAKHKTGFNAVF